jgi:hypothetical protein
MPAVRIVAEDGLVLTEDVGDHAQRRDQACLWIWNAINVGRPEPNLSGMSVEHRGIQELLYERMEVVAHRIPVCGRDVTDRNEARLGGFPPV